MLPLLFTYQPPPDLRACVTVSDGLAPVGSLAAGNPSWLITLGIGIPGGVTPFLLMGLGTSPGNSTAAFTVIVSDALIMVVTVSDALLPTVIVTAQDALLITVTVSDAGACSNT